MTSFLQTKHLLVTLPCAAILAVGMLGPVSSARAATASEAMPATTPAGQGASRTDGSTRAGGHDGKVDYCQAGKIATTEYGGTVREIESDHYRDTPVWEVKIRDSRQGRIEVKVDKNTGKILKVERD